MRARVAYISSLGTTAILVAAALLMLAVVGAIVAFKGWPGAANGAEVQPVPLTSPLSRASATLVANRASHRAVVRSSRVVATRAAGRLSTAGLVKQVGPGPAVGGIVKVTTGGPGPSMRGVFPQPTHPLPSFPAPAGRNPVTVQLPPTSPGGGSTTLVPVQLPTPSVSPPVTAQVGDGVGQVVAHAPSPPAAVESVRSVLPVK